MMILRGGHDFSDVGLVGGGGGGEWKIPSKVEQGITGSHQKSFF